MKRILLIESDAVISSFTRELLENFDYKVLSAEDGRKGIKLAKEIIPDLIICSVELSDINGFSVLSELSKNNETAVLPFIFTTSSKKSLSDFRYGMELGADDYLIKPLESSILLQSVNARINKYEKIIKKYESKEKKNGTKNNAKKKLSEDDHLFLMVGNHPEIIKVNSIVYITAAEEYSNVYCLQGNNLLVQRLLKDWEKMLPEKTFLRIHRSTIINLNYIKKIEKWFNHSFRIYMKDFSEPLIISRRFSSRLRSILRFSK